jgi:hypothetical protein
MKLIRGLFDRLYLIMVFWDHQNRRFWEQTLTEHGCQSVRVRWDGMVFFRKDNQDFEVLLCDICLYVDYDEKNFKVIRGVQINN